MPPQKVRQKTFGVTSNLCGLFRLFNVTTDYIFASESDSSIFTVKSTKQPKNFDETEDFRDNLSKLTRKRI